MKVKWFVESYGQENIELLINSIKNSDAELMYDKNCIYKDLDDLLSKEECVVYYGSLEFAKDVRRKAKWIPGVYCDFQKFKCSYYYPRLYNFILNQDHIFLPYGELLSKKDFLLSTLGNNNCLFIRPDGGDKLFTGKIVYNETYEKDINFMGFYDVPPEALCVVSEPINIQEEYRVFIVNKKAITASLYKKDGKTCYSAQVSNEILAYAEESAKVFEPEICFVVDIATIKGGTELRVLELNSFSCSGIYACDTDKIVEAVNKVAIEEWNSYQI